MTYLIALARAGHFGRAAEICNVSQPALSSAIRHLEEELRVTLIRRGQRFEGFTPEGERLLAWARKLSTDWEGMKQEAARCHGHLTGSLRIGAIPTALPITPLFSEPYQAAHAGVKIELFSLCAEEIIRQLDEFRLDLGLTYLDDARLKGFRSLPLYCERYVLLSRAGEFPPHMDWAEAANYPLCLLTPNMQNRRIIDAAFRDAGAVPRVQVETDSVIALYAHVRYAGLCAVIPHSLLCLFELRQEVTAVPLKPELSRQIGLVARQQDLPAPVPAAAWQIVGELDLQTRFDALIDAMN
ncbi:MAG: LysR family transcriptional regulator [Methylotetracoccus sp.]